MSEAPEAACKELHDIGQPEVMREIIAGRIVAAAKIGERHPARLLAAALAGDKKADRRPLAPALLLIFGQRKQ